MKKAKSFDCKKIGHCANQCPNKKKGRDGAKIVASTKIEEFVKKFEKEFSLVSYPLGKGSARFEDIGAWRVGSGSSRHMIGLRIILQGQPVVGSKMILDSWSVQVPGIIDCEASSSIVTRLS